MAIQALIFDYGDVLDHVDDRAALLVERDRLAATLNLDREGLWSALHDGDYWPRAKRGKLTRAAYRDAVLRPLGISDPEAQRTFFRDLHILTEGVHPEMRALLGALKPKYRLALLSNTDLVELETWLADEADLKDVFDVVVGSAQIGMAKPEPAIYQVTLRALNITPDEALFIDDKPRNTEAAQALGIASIVFESPGQLRAALRVYGITVRADDQAAFGKPENQPERGCVTR